MGILNPDFPLNYNYSVSLNHGHRVKEFLKDGFLWIISINKNNLVIEKFDFVYCENNITLTLVPVVNKLKCLNNYFTSEYDETKTKTTIPEVNVSFIVDVANADSTVNGVLDEDFLNVMYPMIG